MRTILSIAAMLVALLLLAGAAATQPCGNINGDSRGNVDVADLVYLINYLAFDGPPIPDPSSADLDSRFGLTISDAVNFSDYIFGGSPGINCNPTQNYTFGTLPGDTLFFPIMMNVPDGIDSVSLPITMSYASSSYALYLPFLRKGAGSTANFTLHSVTIDNTSTIVAHANNVQDTTILVLLYYPYKPPVSGRVTAFTLNYTRTAPGTGVIIPQLVDRNSLWVPSYEHNGDMYRPLVIPNNLLVPAETLKTVPTQLTYSAMAGRVAKDSFLLSFSSTGIPISFTLTASDPWIILKDLPPTGLTTPATIWVKADASALPMGPYDGTITMTPSNPETPVAPATVGVSFTVTPPVIYPPGDFNCDGIANSADLAAFISYLTGGGAILHDCNQ